MPGSEGGASVELALSELRRSVDVGLTSVDGKLALLLQRADAQDRRADEQAAELRAHDARLDEVERQAVTRADLDEHDTRRRAEEAQERARADEAARRRLTILGLILTAVGVSTAVVSAILTATLT
jgi:hypothetical protein